MTTTLESVTDSRTAETRGGDSCPASCSPSRTHLDLFTGIGGFALAAQWAGLQTIGFSEIDEYANRVLKRNWPNVPNHGDIRNVRNIRAWLVTGGFPCQPYSLAGKRAGASDDRALWPEMLRVVDEGEPTWVLGENVPGIVNLELDRVLADLESLDYACWPIIVPAVACDAKHRRDRVWIVAHSERERSATGAEQSRRQAGTDSNRRCAWPTVADADETGRRERRRAEPIQPQQHPAEYAGENVSNANGVNGDTRGHGTSPRPLIEARRISERLWQPEPGMGRVVDGIPNRAHRIRGLGNAIVPELAFRFIRWMLETEMTWMENAPHEPCGATTKKCEHANK